MLISNSKLLNYIEKKILIQKNNTILKYESIDDVVISYVNITDINLKRNGTKSCGKKDIENGKLRYFL